MSKFEVVEICAGAGGQALGLERAGFEHRLAVELDHQAAQTLRFNREWDVAEGDVASTTVWNPLDFVGVDLLAGGVPCPPFSMAGKQLGSGDERDLFAWAVELAAVMRPRAVMLENVRGLSANRFSAYRQRVLDRFAELGYVAEWRLLQAADFGVAQLRPRFVLVALTPEDAQYFHWPTPPGQSMTVGTALRDLMAQNGWKFADDWADLANGVGPTIVGGSKKHGGADLGPTRAKRSWAELFVDGKGVADAAPLSTDPSPHAKMPRLTVEMVARLQGWRGDDWAFTGKKTSKYRQIGNAFPPPVAEAVGLQVREALDHVGKPRELAPKPTMDPIYKILREASAPLRIEQIIAKLDTSLRQETVEKRIANIARDFELDIELSKQGSTYALGEFKGFIGQSEHHRFEYMENFRSRVS